MADLTLDNGAPAAPAVSQKKTPAAPFSAGDLVQLRSGSVPMTVEGVDGDTITCSWFSGVRAANGAELRRSTIAPAALERSTASSRPLPAQRRPVTGVRAALAAGVIQPEA